MKYHLLPLLAVLAGLSGCHDDRADKGREGHHVWEHQVDALRQAETVADQVNTQQADDEAALRKLGDQQ